MIALSLFSGVEGLGLAVAEVFGAHPVCFAEYEKNPSKVLAARYPDVFNVGDVTTADWSAYGDVEVIHGGPPCQPFSAAGRREGMADDRWMWPAMERAVRMVRPRYVVVENVPPLVASDAWGVIVSDLASLGYVGSWLCLRASDVGACHRRERVFLLATHTAGATHRGEAGHQAGGAFAGGPSGGVGRPSDGPAPDAERHDGCGGDDVSQPSGIGQLRDAPCGDAWPGGLPALLRGPVAPHPDHPGPSEHGRTVAGGAQHPTTERRGADVAHADSGRWDSGDRFRRRTGRAGTEPADDGGPAVADADLDGLESLGRSVLPGRFARGDADGRDCQGLATWGDYAPAIARHALALGRPAPAPVDERGRLSARFVEWMQMFPEGWVTDVLPRNPALKALGNAVVPAQGAMALRLLLARVGDRVAA